MDDEGFAGARKKVEELYTRMDNKTIRKVYAYYKQATEGDISGKRPSALRFRDRVKFLMWHCANAIRDLMAEGELGEGVRNQDGPL